MRRRSFIKNTSVLGIGLLASDYLLAATPVTSSKPSNFPIVRVPLAKRHFRSAAVDHAIKTFQTKVKNPELAWLFENCFP
ncbi:MAG: glycoside hydrolase family 125 protein, partial [Bacteroidia bacterium]